MLNTCSNVEKLLMSKLNVNNFDRDRLINMILRNESSYKICKELNISREVLLEKLKELREVGRKISKTYNYDGSISFLADSTNKTKCIMIPDGVNYLKTCVISDIHIGNEYEDLKLLDSVFNYCEKNNIHIIFNCGDFIDGTKSKFNQYINDPFDQIERLLLCYPKSDSIITIGVCGNHDHLIYPVYDLITACNNNREDIFIGGYGSYQVNLKNDFILLHHKIKGNRKISNLSYFPLILEGHSHLYSFDEESRVLKVPSLSGLNKADFNAIELYLNFDGDKIDSYDTLNINFKNNGDIEYFDGINYSL